jgi:perosamine synthetase
LAQLQKCDQFWQRRCQIADFYREELLQVEELDLPPCPNEVKHSWHLFILRLRSKCLAINRDEFIKELRTLGVGTSVHFIPLHRHPYYVREYGYNATDFPHADDSYSRCFSVPIYPDLSEAEMKRVVASIKTVIHRSVKNGPVVSTR